MWVPGTLKPNAKLPVLVWIHGGGYVFYLLNTSILLIQCNSYVGGNVVGTTGVDLIREAGGGLIAVTLDYRLGVFGMYSAKSHLTLLSQLRW